MRMSLKIVLFTIPNISMKLIMKLMVISRNLQIQDKLEKC